MAFDQIYTANVTGQIIEVLLRDSTTGLGKTGLAAGAVSVYMIREGSSPAVAVPLTAGTLGVWSSGGWVEVDAANMPGFYQLGIPNSALQGGAKGVSFALRATATIDVRLRFLLVAEDLRGSLIPAPITIESAVWDAPIANHTGTTAFGGFLQARLDVSVSTRLAATGNDTASVVAAVWNAGIASFVTGGTFGGFLQTRLDVATSTRLAATAGITAADVWAYTAGAGRTLTTLNGLTPNSAFFTNAPSGGGGGGGTIVVQIAAAGIMPGGSAPVQNALPDLIRGDDYVVQIDLPADLTGVSALWLAFKRSKLDPDADSILFAVAGGAGFVLVDGVTTPFFGLLTIVDAANGIVGLSLPETLASLIPHGKLTWIAKASSPGLGTKTLAFGGVSVVGPFIEAV